MSNTRKFKAPFDMYKGDVKKGTISDHYNEEEDSYHFKTTYGGVYLPAPIVEQWEEVVDETQKNEFIQELKDEIENNIESLNKLKKAIETGYIVYETK